MVAVVIQAGFSPFDLSLKDGRRVRVRAVCPEDRDALQDAMKRLSEPSRYSRFMSPLRELPPKMLERAVHPEAGREFQLVAVSGDESQRVIVGGARYAATMGSQDCEFAVTVADAWRGFGLARQLLEALIRVARAAGFQRMEGYILASNAPMLGLAKRLGFERVACPEGPTVQLVQCKL